MNQHFPTLFDENPQQTFFRNLKNFCLCINTGMNPKAPVSRLPQVDFCSSCALASSLQNFWHPVGSKVLVVNLLATKSHDTVSTHQCMSKTDLF